MKSVGLFKAKVTVETQMVWEKTYKLCDSKGYAYNMSVYLGRDRKCAAVTVTTIHAAVSGLTTRTENLVHKLYMDNFSILLIYLTIYLQRS
jgi:hypothetical protein